MASIPPSSTVKSSPLQQPNCLAAPNTGDNVAIIDLSADEEEATVKQEPIDFGGGPKQLDASHFSSTVIVNDDVNSSARR